MQVNEGFTRQEYIFVRNRYISSTSSLKMTGEDKNIRASTWCIAHTEDMACNDGHLPVLAPRHGLQPSLYTTEVEYELVRLTQRYLDEPVR